jgi:monothiol glutaredoxin
MAVKTSDKIRQQIAENPVIIYMKGSPDLPMCGFSGNAVAALKSTGVPFAHVDILQNMPIMQALPEISDWPTFPQIFIDGELIGGGDIVIELNKTGELKTLMDAAVAKTAEA